MFCIIMCLGHFRQDKSFGGTKVTIKQNVNGGSGCDYGEEIVKMIRMIDDKRFLRCVYVIISDYLKEKAE